ncbi:MAG: hypothetical protein F4010_03390 [Cenarchaeum sp. SB0669_bin_11]|nr:hypothetical protein [Cenarchaeum sp. SB0669_bin_11]
MREEDPPPIEYGSIFDEADIIFLDYDLLDVDEDSYITGQELAYLVRCYSSCGLIVVMNEGEVVGRPTFELRLETPIDHFADLRISSTHLGNPGLWSDDFIGYRPWAWPILSKEVASFAARVEIVRERLDESVLETLKLNDLSDWLSQRAVEALGIRGSLKQLTEITFQDVVAPGSTLGIRSKDVLDGSQIPRVAAARVSRWLKSLVLPAQDPFIDAPHLVSRFPSLIERWREISGWNKTATLTSDLTALGLGHTPVSDSVIDLSPWNDHALWLWSSVRENRDIPEVSDPWGSEQGPVVFLEDLSQFIRRDAALGFASQVPSMHDIRFVLATNTSGAARLLKREKKRAKARGVEWDPCDPTSVTPYPSTLLAE